MPSISQQDNYEEDGYDDRNQNTYRNTNYNKNNKKRLQSRDFDSSMNDNEFTTRNVSNSRSTTNNISYIDNNYDNHQYSSRYSRLPSSRNTNNANANRNIANGRRSSNIRDDNDYDNSRNRENRDIDVDNREPSNRYNINERRSTSSSRRNNNNYDENADDDYYNNVGRSSLRRNGNYTNSSYDDQDYDRDNNDDDHEYISNNNRSRSSSRAARVDTENNANMSEQTAPTSTIPATLPVSQQRHLESLMLHRQLLYEQEREYLQGKLDENYPIQYILLHSLIFVLISLTIIGLQIAMIVNQVALANIASGIWCGVYYLIAVGLALSTIFYRKYSLMHASLLMHFFGMFLAIGGLILVNVVAVTRFSLCNSRWFNIMCTNKNLEGSHVAMIVFGVVCFTLCLIYFTYIQCTVFYNTDRNEQNNPSFQRSTSSSSFVRPNYFM